MKNKIFSICAIALALSLSSCNLNDNDGEDSNDPLKNELASYYNTTSFLYGIQEIAINDVQQYSVGVLNNNPTSNVTITENTAELIAFTINLSSLETPSQIGKNGKIYVRLTNTETTGYFTTKTISFDPDYQISIDGIKYKLTGDINVSAAPKIGADSCVQNIRASNFRLTNSENSSNYLSYNNNDYTLTTKGISTSTVSDNTYKLTGTANGNSSVFGSFSIAIEKPINWVHGGLYTSGQVEYNTSLLILPFTAKFGTPNEGMTITYNSIDYIYSF